MSFVVNKKMKIFLIHHNKIYEVLSSHLYKKIAFRLFLAPKMLELVINSMVEFYHQNQNQNWIKKRKGKREEKEARESKIP